jgi:hypothetical protein
LQTRRLDLRDLRDELPGQLAEHPDTECVAVAAQPRRNDDYASP